MAGNKYISNNAGIFTEVVSNQTSAGAGDAGKIPALNASGILDATIVNSKTSSAGAGDSGKLVALDGSGKIDSTMMPTGVGADTVSIVASEALSAGNFVNIWNNSGTPNVRKADATTSGKYAHGFVLSAVSNGASATVYLGGQNTGVTGMTAGDVFLATTAGTATATAPSGSGNIVQRLGVAVSATAIDFNRGTPVVLA
jgi:hypothetical protein